MKQLGLLERYNKDLSRMTHAKSLPSEWATAVVRQSTSSGVAHGLGCENIVLKRRISLIPTTLGNLGGGLARRNSLGANSGIRPRTWWCLSAKKCLTRFS